MSNQVINQVLLDELVAQYPQDVEVIGEGLQQALVVNPERLVPIMEVLKTSELYQFNMLRNLTAVDYGEYLEMVYHLYSLPLRHKITVKTRCAAEDSQVASVTAIWPSANFQEREVYDLLGVKFTGHPDLRRILMPDDFIGHPLRKSFKVGGN